MTYLNREPAQRPHGQDPDASAGRQAPAGRSRRRVIIGSLAGVTLLLVLGIGGLLLVPRLLGGDKTPTGAMDAAQRSSELLADGDFGGYYDMTDNEYKAKVSRADFIRVSRCNSASVRRANHKIVPVDADVNGDSATVRVTVADDGRGTIELIWQDDQWRLRVGNTLSAGAQHLYKTLCK